MWYKYPVVYTRATFVQGFEQKSWSNDEITYPESSQDNEIGFTLKTLAFVHGGFWVLLSIIFAWA